jgi:hypothetical protein
MIAKHVPMKSVKKSDFASLVNYLADDQAKQSRVAYTSVTHCESSDLQAAFIEVMAIQSMNTRAESDKTYHLILSFRAGERPDDDVLKAIEREVCVGLGYDGHQRISVAHDDTDNFHLHIAINKIHPTRLTIHNPYNDHKTLGRLCTALELQYGLARDNHSAVRVGSENRALDMEHHAGVESLLGWIKRECLEQLLAATSWSELHRELHERGNGLVICDQAGLMVKASSVARTLSKTKLLERFGNFKPPSDADPQHNHKHLNAQSPVKYYAARPVRTRMDTTLLFSRYKNEQQGIAGYRAKAGQAARAKKARLIADLKSKATLKRATIKLAGGSRAEKKCLYALISHSVKSELKRINEHFKQEREQLIKQYQPLQWADWLRREATSGNPEALAALRARLGREALGLKGNSNTVSANGGVLQKTGLNAVQDSITKKGTIIYRVGSSAVRDEGDRLKVSRGTTREGLAAALCLAMERYGTHITVTGSAEFKAQIVEVAANAKLPLMFTDAILEAQRLALIKQANTRQQLSMLTVKDTGPEIEANKLMPVRQSFAASALAPLSFAAADQYIQEREQKRLKILDILKHRRYTNADVGVLAFMGVRHSTGESLALLKRDEVILVMPIDEKTAQRLSRLAIGDPVTCKGLGVVKTRGKSR